MMKANKPLNAVKFRIISGSSGFGIVTLLLICVSIILALRILYVSYCTSGLSQPVIIELPRGVSAVGTFEILHSSSVVKSKKIFLGYLKITRSSRSIKSGVYKFYPQEDVFRVAHRLIRGDTYRIKITVPEGWDSSQIAALLKERGLGNPERFLKYVKENKLEGYLFPETYYFDYGMREEYIAERMRQEFFRRVTPEMIERAANLGLNLSRWVTLASIIEKEATLRDRRLVSAVFHNRLKRNMYLESCATVLYALGFHKEKLSYADLKVKSPYNTYTHMGLPPGPIANPGMDSLLAAINPEDTDALFFVVSKSTDGIIQPQHIFSRYYKDHINVQLKPKSPSENTRQPSGRDPSGKGATPIPAEH